MASTVTPDEFFTLSFLQFCFGWCVAFGGAGWSECHFVLASLSESPESGAVQRGGYEPVGLRFSFADSIRLRQSQRSCFRHRPPRHSRHRAGGGSLCVELGNGQHRCRAQKRNRTCEDLARFVLVDLDVLLAGEHALWIVAFRTVSFCFYAFIVAVPILAITFLTYKNYLEKVQASIRHVEEVTDLHLRTIEALAIAIDAKDEVTHDHVHRVRDPCDPVSRGFRLSEPGTEALG